jgi:hypothetical protein
LKFHRHYLSVVEEIERNYPVACWKSGDVEIWPLARMDIYLEMYWATMGGAVSAMPTLARRVFSRIAAPLINLWNCRRDLAHWVGSPKPAYAIFLGDGVSLDCIDGAWQDRYAEPVMAALEQAGMQSFLMQSGELPRLPWRRPTFAANLVAAQGSLARFGAPSACHLPDHGAVIELLERRGFPAKCLSRLNLARRARLVAATASAFERVLRVVKPKLAFVVSYYAGLGPAFVLACRRQGVFSVDLQHCSQEGPHKAYCWSALPETGYRTLPASFWNWTQHEASHIESWASRLPERWHRSHYGGHVQLGAFLDDADPATQEWDGKFAATGSAAFEREILVALQPMGGFQRQWDTLVAQIRAAPPTWRFWIRRHPAGRAYQDLEHQGLISLCMPNVVVDSALSWPLPVLLRHVNVVVSRFSGVSAEAAMFGVPALFLSEEAQGQFSALIERGCASVIDITTLNAVIARLPAGPTRPKRSAAPTLATSLATLTDWARDYSRLLARIENGVAGS